MKITKEVFVVLTFLMLANFLSAEPPLHLRKVPPNKRIQGGVVRGQKRGGDWWGGGWYNYYPLGYPQHDLNRVYNVYPYYKYYPYYDNYYYIYEEP